MSSPSLLVGIICTRGVGRRGDDILPTYKQHAYTRSKDKANSSLWRGEKRQVAERMKRGGDKIEMAREKKLVRN